MTAKAYADNEPEPNPARKAWRKITLGATHYAPPSPVAGEVFIPVRQSFGGSINFDPAGKAIDDGILGTGILKGPADAHRLFVGNTPVTVVTPAEFTFESAILRAYFPKQAAMPATEQERWQAVIAAAHQNGDIVPNGPGEALLRTHKTVRVGEPVIRFDVLTGDMVFVDRLSYNFTKPKLGDAFVFRTRDVPGFSPPRDDFYIKRLVGRPGDTLRVEYPKLFVNGVVASGNPGFDNNNAARHELEYHGYLPDIGGARYPLHDDMKLPDASYWAMGDNSANSSDSRVFGVVPEKALVGRALFIVHPFTDRWGPAK